MAYGYFSLFLIYGLLVPFLSPTLLELGYSTRQVGFIQAGMYFFGTIAPILGGRISDRYLTPDKMIRLLGFAMFAISLPLWWRSQNPTWFFILLLLLLMAARAPMVSLHDTLAMKVAGQEPNRFARFRVMGSIGFVVGAIVLGWILGKYGWRAFFPSLAVCTAIQVFTTRMLPGGRFESDESDSVDTGGFWAQLDGKWWLWLGAMMLHWFCFGPYHYGFTLLLQEQGVANEYSGFFWTLAVGAEIVFFLWSGRLFARFSNQVLLVFAFGSSLLRWILLAAYPEPWLIAVTQILHGPGFSLFYGAAMQGLREFHKGRFQASYQGLFSTCVGGVSSVLGMIFSGWLHAKMPFHELLWWLVPFQAAAIGLLWWTRRGYSDKRG